MSRSSSGVVGQDDVTHGDHGTLRIVPGTGRYTAPFQFAVYFSPRAPTTDEFFTPFGAPTPQELHHGAQLLLTIEDVDHGDLLLAARPVPVGSHRKLEAGNYHVLASLVSRHGIKIASTEVLFEVASPFALIDKRGDDRPLAQQRTSGGNVTTMPLLPRQFPTPPAEPVVHHQYEDLMRVAAAAQRGEYIDLRTKLGPDGSLSPSSGKVAKINSPGKKKSGGSLMHNEAPRTAAERGLPTAFAHKPSVLRSGEPFSLSLDAAASMLHLPEEDDPSTEAPLRLSLLLDLYPKKAQVTSPSLPLSNQNPLLVAATFEANLRRSQMPARGASLSWQTTGHSLLSKRGSLSLQEGRQPTGADDAARAAIALSNEFIGCSPNVSIFSGITFQLAIHDESPPSDIFIAFRSKNNNAADANESDIDENNLSAEEDDERNEDGSTALDLRTIGPNVLPYLHFNRSPDGGRTVLFVKQPGGSSSSSSPLFETALDSRRGDNSAQFSFFLRVGDNAASALVLCYNDVVVYSCPVSSHLLDGHALRTFVSMKTSSPIASPVIHNISLLSHHTYFVVAVDDAVLHFDFDSVAVLHQTPREEKEHPSPSRGLRHHSAAVTGELSVWLADQPVLSAASAAVALFK